LVIDPHFPGRGVERDVARRHDQPQNPSGTAQKSTDTRNQFLHFEGFQQIVVGAGIQAFDAVVQAVAGSQNQDRNHIPLFPPLLKQGQAIRIRKPEIKNDRIVLDARHGGVGAGPGIHHINGKCLIFQADFDGLGKPVVIFD